MDKIEIDEDVLVEVEAEGNIMDLSILIFNSDSIIGHDLSSLLYNFMSEFLSEFGCDFVVPKEVEITEWDRENFKIKAVG